MLLHCFSGLWAVTSSAQNIAHLPLCGPPKQVTSRDVVISFSSVSSITKSIHKSKRSHSQQSDTLARRHSTSVVKRLNAPKENGSSITQLITENDQLPLISIEDDASFTQIISEKDQSHSAIDDLMESLRSKNTTSPLSYGRPPHASTLNLNCSCALVTLDHNPTKFEINITLNNTGT